jgi:hypothetical protein
MNTHGYTLRAQALRVPCDFCAAPIDQECHNRKGEPLEHQPAHLKRLQAAGVDPKDKPAPDLGCDDDPPF